MRPSTKSNPRHGFRRARTWTALLTLAVAPALGGGSVAAGETAAPGWARQLGGPNREWALAIAGDDGGGVYVAGHFHGETAIGDRRLASEGGSDVFLAALGPAGETRWARRFGARGQDEGRAVAAAGDAVWVAGFFSSRVDFGGHELESAGASDVFLARLDARSGNVLWARRLGGPWGDVAFDLAPAADGGVAVVGYLQNRVDLDPGPEETILESAGRGDAFVARYDAEGALRWARRLGGEGDDQGRAVTVAPDGGVAVLGNFERGLTTAAGARLESAGRDDLFLWRLDAAGRELGVSGFGGPGVDSGEDLARAADGKLYAAGSFAGPFAAAGSKLEPGGAADALLLALDPAGAPRWARAIGGAGSEFAFGVAIDGDDRVLVAGFSQLAADASPVSGAAESFLHVFDTAGAPLAERKITGSIAVQALGLALAGDRPCLAGGFRGEIDVAPVAGGEVVHLPGAGKLDVYVVCLDADAPR